MGLFKGGGNLMEIQNKTLVQYASVIKNKNVQDLQLQDLESLETIRISNVDDQGKRIYSFDELLPLKKLKSVIVSLSIVMPEDLTVLSKIVPQLETLEFHNCVFIKEEELSKLCDIKNIAFEQCYHQDLSFIKTYKNIESFSLRYPYNDVEVGLELFMHKPNMQELNLDGCILIHQECMKYCIKNLQKLSLLDTVLYDYKFLNTMKPSSLIYLPSESMTSPYVQKNKEKLIIRNDYRNQSFSD